MKAIDFKRFSQLYILPNGEPIQFEHWQEEKIVNPIYYALRPDGMRRHNLALIGLPKKNGKSELAGLVASYHLLGDGELEPEVYGTAGSKDQAKIVFGRTKRAIQRSPILLNEVNVYSDVIERRDGQGYYRVLSSDAPIQHGLNPSCVIFDELWNQRTYDLWEALTTSPARSQPLTFCITYAGYRPFEGDLLWDVYSRGLRGDDRRMYFFWTSQNLASWITPEYLKQQRQRLPDHIFKRLHQNQWTTGSGSFLTREDVEAATDPELRQTWRGERFRATYYHAALDLGLRRDRTAICVVHKAEDGRIQLDHLRLFEAPKGGEVRVEDVEEALLELARAFRPFVLTFDPWQAIRTAQRLRAHGMRVEEFAFSGQNWTKLTQALFSLFKDRRIRLFRHPELVKELLSVSIVEKSYGFRLDHDSGQHDDCVVALGMASMSALTKQVKRAGTWGRDRGLGRGPLGQKVSPFHGEAGNIRWRDVRTGIDVTPEYLRGR